MTHPVDRAAEYEARAARHGAARDAARRSADRIGVARLAAALVLVAALVAGGRGAIGRPGALLLAGIAAVGFAWLVHLHARVRSRERAAAVRHLVARRGAARVRREWGALPVPAWPLPADAPWPPLAEDLYVLGRASLAQLLDVVTPLLGGPRLAAWLMADPPPVPVIHARQAAVRALVDREAFLEECAALAEGARGVGGRSLERLLAWAEGPSAAGAARLRAAAVLGPLLTVAAIALGGAGVVPLGLALAVGVALNLVMSALAHRALRPLLSPLSDLPTLLAPALALLARVDAEPVEAPAWRDVQARVRRAGGTTALARLARWIAWSEARHSPMLHGALAATVAWDAVLLAGLDRWHRASGAAARGWFDALADAEALVALATLARDEPTWCLPEPCDDGTPCAALAATLEATALAHPLLGAGRVPNAVRLGGPGSLLMVSGSNMAGKTTLLRAVGANVLLAQAGGPACAAAMRWRPVRVRTSVRVHDALEEGVSLFLAELRRLRDVVAAAGAPGAAPVLYLFDEVLHGTNSHDRREATRAVLARLAAHGAVGVVTTHDLELADDPALATTTTHVHFRERYAGDDGTPRMAFDYVAHPGRATSANALALLALLGLGRADDGTGQRTPS